MNRTIVVDDEYLRAELAYKDAANRVHEATEFFKKSINEMVNKNAMVGQAATNMITFMNSMASVLKGTFKEQVTLESVLCREYLQKIDKADKSKTFDPSTTGVKEVSFKTYPTPYSDGKIILNKGEVQRFVTQLKQGPVMDIMNYLAYIKDVSFDKSMGAVQEQNETIKEATVDSLRALTQIFDAFIDRIESTATALQEADESIASRLEG